MHKEVNIRSAHFLVVQLLYLLNPVRILFSQSCQDRLSVQPLCHVISRGTMILDCEYMQLTSISHGPLLSPRPCRLMTDTDQVFKQSQRPKCLTQKPSIEQSDFHQNNRKLIPDRSSTLGTRWWPNALTPGWRTSYRHSPTRNRSLG